MIDQKLECIKIYLKILTNYWTFYLKMNVKSWNFSKILKNSLKIHKIYEYLHICNFKTTSKLLNFWNDLGYYKVKLLRNEDIKICH